MADTPHTELGGSGAPRWTRCARSVWASRGKPSESSEYAKEGTLAHGLGEYCLLKSVSTYEAVDSGFSFDVSDKDELPDIRFPDEEMVEYVQGYVDRCNDFDGDRMIEVMVRFDPWVPGNLGHIDFACFDIRNRRLIIRDLKYGQGVEVDAEESEQLLLYAIGVIEEYGFLYDIDTILMEIDQPRLGHVSSWEIDYNTLMAKAVWFHERYLETLNPDSAAVPGEKQCKWCKAKDDCKALFELTFNTVAEEFEVVEDD